MTPGLRRTAAGVVDQVVNSGSNYLTAFLASLVLPIGEFGGFVLAYAVVTVLLAGARAVVGEALLAHLPTVATVLQRSLARSALGTAVLLGLVAAAICLAGGLFGGSSLDALLAFVPWLPAAMVADAARFVVLSRGDTVRALVLDSVWAAVQLAVLAAAWTTGTLSVASLATAWGVGAAAAAAVYLAMTREWPGRPAAWWAESRYLSGWFTLTSVLGQVQIYLVLLLAGAVLTADDTAGLRAVQLLVFQPAITLMAALLVLLTPAMARYSSAGDLAGLYRLRRTALLVMAVVGGIVLLAIPLRDVLLSVLFPQYTAYAVLVAPIALQTAVGGLTVPFQAQLRGFRQGRALFGQQVVQLVTLVGGAVLGLAHGGVRGLAWSMAGATLLALVSMALAAARSRRDVDRGMPASAAEVLPT